MKRIKSRAAFFLLAEVLFFCTGAVRAKADTSVPAQIPCEAMCGEKSALFCRRMQEIFGKARFLKVNIYMPRREGVFAVAVFEFPGEKEAQEAQKKMETRMAGRCTEEKIPYRGQTAEHRKTEIRHSGCYLIVYLPAGEETGDVS